MKRIAFGALFLLYCIIAIGQTEHFKDSMMLYYENNNFEKAVFWGEKNAALVKSAVGVSDTAYAEAINSLALSYYQNSNYQPAKTLFIEAAGIYKKLYGTANQRYLSILVNLSDACQKKGEFEEGSDYLLEAIHTREQAADTLNPDFADCLASLGVMKRLMGNYAQSEKLYLRSSIIYEKAGLTSDMRYARLMNSLGALYYFIGKYKEAEFFLQQSVSLHKSILGADNWEYAVAANSLASLYYQLGNYTAAADIFTRIQPVVEKQLTASHPFFATVTGNLASVYMQLGMYEQSAPYMLRQLQINKDKFGENSQEYSVPLNNLGNLYFRLKDFGKARQYYSSSATLRKKVYGEKSIFYGVAINNLALLHTRDNTYKAADSLFNYSMQLLSESAGTNHPEYLNVLNNYCEHLLRSGQYKTAAHASLQLLATEKELLKEKLDYLSVSELQAYTANKSAAFMEPVAALSFQHSANLARAVYDNLLFLKGIAIQNFTSLSKEMEHLSDSNVVNRWKKYKADKVVLNKLLVTPAPKRTLNVDSLTADLNAQEKALLKIATPYREVKAKLTIGWQQVQASLNNNEAAAEYVRYRILNRQNDYEYRYGALLLRSGDSLPVFIKLCTEDELTASLKRFAYKNNSLPVAKTTTAKSLYELVIKPIEKYLTGIHTFYFSPDGLLHQLSFAAIPMAGNQLLIDRYKLVQLTSTRQIAIKDDVADTVTTAALFGGIDYNRQNTDTAATPNADAFAYVYQQNHRSFSDSFPALPNTLQEIDNITASLQTVHAGIYRYTGTVASESNFRTLCNTIHPSLIHFATHGFTLPDTAMHLKINNVYAASNNPLLRTGLIMAAGNKGWKSRNQLNEDDGILTGLEIAAMQLQHTQLAVLSACETANGEVRGSEGVFGLQRAFKMAGVNYVLATLWQVPDAETKTFMTLFYKNWLTGNSIQNAFYLTQRSFRQRKTPPYFWAGFVLIK